jgi:hypothetical protein
MSQYLQEVIKVEKLIIYSTLSSNFLLENFVVSFYREKSPEVKRVKVTFLRKAVESVKNLKKIVSILRIFSQFLQIFPLTLKCEIQNRK